MRWGIVLLALLVAAGCRDSGLSNDSLRRAVRAMEAGDQLPEGVEAEGERLRVEIHHDLSGEEAVALVESVGGVVEGTLDGVVQALVPYQSLEDLESRAGIQFIRPPPRVDIPEGG
ncbi:MAG: hypothetical protein ACLFWM_12885 [Actinomycetota bacterium]